MTKKIDEARTRDLSPSKRLKVKDKICISFFFKGIRRVIRINPKIYLARQLFLLKREYQNMLRDIRSNIKN